MTLKPLNIGSVTIDTPIILAPMAGVTDLPFRLLCKQMGAGLLCMEMVSAKAIHYRNKNTESLMAIDERERPVSLQLFGSEPELMAEVAHSIEERPFALLDLTENSLQVTHRRVTYDVEAVVQELARHNLPAIYGEMFRLGRKLN